MMCFRWNMPFSAKPSHIRQVAVAIVYNPCSIYTLRGLGGFYKLLPPPTCPLLLNLAWNNWVISFDISGGLWPCCIAVSHRLWMCDVDCMQSLLSSSYFLATTSVPHHMIFACQWNTCIHGTYWQSTLLVWLQCNRLPSVSQTPRKPDVQDWPDQSFGVHPESRTRSRLEAVGTVRLTVWMMCE